MIKYIKGDIFQSTMQTLVNPVNTVGVMGAGLAKQFAEKYPKMAKEYAQYGWSDSFDVGCLWIYRTDDKWILNFPTKTDWHLPSKLWYVELGLKTFVDTYEQEGVESVAFPKLGCGLGKLRWLNIKRLFELYLAAIDIPVEVYI